MKVARSLWFVYIMGIFALMSVGASAAFALIDAASGVASLASRIWPSAMGFVALVSAGVVMANMLAAQRRMPNG